MLQIILSSYLCILLEAQADDHVSFLEAMSVCLPETATPKGIARRTRLLWTMPALRSGLLAMNMPVTVLQKLHAYLGILVPVSPLGDHWVHWCLACPERNQKAA